MSPEEFRKRTAEDAARAERRKDPPKNLGEAILRAGHDHGWGRPETPWWRNPELKWEDMTPAQQEALRKEMRRHKPNSPLVEAISGAARSVQAIMPERKPQLAPAPETPEPLEWNKFMDQQEAARALKPQLAPASFPTTPAPVSSAEDDANILMGVRTAIRAGDERQAQTLKERWLSKHKKDRPSE